jgi:AhpD family alkylhydroperoxidase
MSQATAPLPITQDVVPEGESEAFIPYPPIGERLEHIPINVRPEVHYYISRMAFLPNAIKLYLHNPWSAEHLIKLNNAVMRSEQGSLTEEFKYRLAFVASRDNECTYCTAHHAATLKRRWNYTEGDLTGVLSLDQPADEREAVAFEYVHQASLDATGVTDELRSRLAEHFTPEEIVEITLVLGFWKMYNTMHTAMGVPLEDPVLGDARWVEVPPHAGS